MTNYGPVLILFDKWYDQLYFNIWDEIREVDDSIDILYPETWLTIALMENDPENIFFDIKATSEKEILKMEAQTNFQKDNLFDDPKLLSFYVWLKSKITKQDLYELLKKEYQILG